MTECIKIQSLKFLCLCVIGFTASGIAYSQNSMGAKFVSMGQAGVALPGSDWSLFSNSALIPTNRNTASFYRFQYVGISEITDMAAVLNLQTRIGTLSFGIHRYGFNLFSENRLLIGFKRNFGTFHAGISAGYYHVSQGGDYGSAGALGLNIGIAAELDDGLWIGARATNINYPTYGKSDETVPRDLSLGFSYQLAENTVLSMEAMKDVMFPLSLRSGLQIEIVPSLFARAGFTSNPETYSFGFGYSPDRWSINIGLQQHNPLGLSPALDLGINF
tara:strand:+ start:11960 stop:12784 length:825 start_codon:yes stop_codon:yes gene_type:complete